MSEAPADPHARLAKLSHDLRTPLTIVRGFADLLAARPDLDEATRTDYARRIADAAEEAVRLLDAERAERRAEDR
jgi:signal transduction histidine kinase